MKGSAKILRGNCIAVMRAMEPGSVHAVACSPPYRGLRFYTKGLHRNAGNAQGPQPVTTGWRPTCDHAGATLVPATVLDPFSGSGTTALVARRLGRNGIGIELSDGYAKLSEERLKLDEKYGDGPPPESVSRAKAERGRSAPLEDFT